MHRIVASLVRAQPLQFLLNILRWLLVAIPATWTNSWLSYVQNKLAIAYRTRLTEEVMKQYLGNEGEFLQGKVYYKLCKRDLSCYSVLLCPTSGGLANFENRLKNPDQLRIPFPVHFTFLVS